MLLDTKNLKN